MKLETRNPDPTNMTRPRAVLGQTLQGSQTFGSLVRNDTSGELSNHGTDGSGGSFDACPVESHLDRGVMSLALAHRTGLADDDYSERLLSDRSEQ